VTATDTKKTTKNRSHEERDQGRRRPTKIQEPMIDARFDDPTLQEFPSQKPNTVALASTPQIFFCFLNYLTGPLTNNNEFKHTKLITFQKCNP